MNTLEHLINVMNTLEHLINVMNTLKLLINGMFPSGDIKRATRVLQNYHPGSLSCNMNTAAVHCDLW